MGCLFLAFFPIPLSHATNKLDIFLILFVVVSHCDKELFLLLHWATATNRFFVCCSESLWQTKFCKGSKKEAKMGPKMLHLLVRFAIFWHFVCLFFSSYFCSKILHTLALFYTIYTNFVSRYNSISRSDSVPQTK